MYATFAAVAFVIYPFGIPACYWYMLWSNRDVLLNRKHPHHTAVRRQFGFLCDGYKLEVNHEFHAVLSKPWHVLSGVVLGTGLVVAKASVDGNLNISQVTATYYCVDASTILIAF